MRAATPTPDKQAGRAAHIYKDIVGEWPPREWRFDETPNVTIGQHPEQIQANNIRTSGKAKGEGASMSARETTRTRGEGSSAGAAKKVRQAIIEGKGCGHWRIRRRRSVVLRGRFCDRPTNTDVREWMRGSGMTFRSLPSRWRHHQVAQSERQDSALTRPAHPKKRQRRIPWEDSNHWRRDGLGGDGRGTGSKT